MPIILDLPQLTPINALPLLLVIAWELFDVISGLVKAFATGTFSSTVMRQGLWHKLGIMFSMILAYMLQFSTQLIDFSTVGLDYDFEVPITVVFGALLILMETGSIIENIAVINPEIAELPVLRRFVKAVEDVLDGEED